jgi:hypothetical protein
MGEFGSILIVIAGSAATKQSRKRLAHAEARRRKEASKIASEPFEPCLAFPSRLRVKKHPGLLRRLSTARNDGSLRAGDLVLVTRR